MRRLLLSLSLVAACGHPSPSPRADGGLTDAGASPGTPCPAPMTKGPWVQQTDDTHATVKWEAYPDAGCAQIAFAPELPDGGSGSETIASGTVTATVVHGEYGLEFDLPQPDLPGTYDLDEVALSGLAPDTCYDYRVLSSGTATERAGAQDGRFCTSRPAGASFTFLAIGDTNPALGHTVPVLDQVLPARPDFTVHVGDLHYYSSIVETWAYWFGAMAPLLRAGAFFPAIGNHEFELDGGSFTDYYARLFEPQSQDPTEEWFHFESGGIWFFALDTEESLDANSPQVQWLASALANAARQPGFRFSIVFLHRPLYTVGDCSPLLDARAVLDPLFREYGVTLVLQGHMHGYERFEVNGLTYVTCAGGGGLIGDVNAGVEANPGDAALRVVASNHYSACLYRVSPGSLASTVLDEDGGVIDRWQKTVP